MDRTGKVIILTGLAAFVLSALTMAALYVHAMFVWAGWPGFGVGLISAPAGSILPFLDWYVEGSPSTLYFSIWGVGVAGMVVSMFWKWWAERLPNRHPRSASATVPALPSPPASTNTSVL